MDLESDVLTLGGKCERALAKCRAYLATQLKTRNDELVFTDQPDQGPPYLGTYGSSCATLALLAAGTNRDEALINDLLKYLCNHQMESGGWTIRNAKSVSLTTACAFSVLALAEASANGDAEQRAIDRGVEWLIKNSTSDGWPFFEGGPEIAVTPTAFAVRALRRVKQKQTLSRSGLLALENGCRCLEEAFGQKAWIASRADDSASVACLGATSVALITLIECDYPAYSEVIRRGHAWLTAQTDWVDDNSDSFYFYGTRPVNSSEDVASGHVNYVHFTSALMLQAILACGSEITDPAVRRLVEHIVGLQREAGDWRSALAPKETPTWMEMDAALALSRAAKAVVAIRPTLSVRGELARLELQAAALKEELDAVSSRQQARLDGIEQLVSSHHDALSVLARGIEFGRAALPYLPIALIVSVYGIIRSQLQASNWITDIIAVIVSALSLVPVFRARRRRKRTTKTVTLESGKLISTSPTNSRQDGAAAIVKGSGAQ